MECGAKGLSSRLFHFRKWLTQDAKCSLHPSVCIVNGEATDGTKNAPVLLFGPPPSSSIDESLSNGGTANNNQRCGNIDSQDDQLLWDRSIGCQVRSVREVKKEEVLVEIPQSSMIVPALVAASDAGCAVFSCCESLQSADPLEYWDALSGTADAVQQQLNRAKAQSGTQLLVNILRERKRAEDALAKAHKELSAQSPSAHVLVPNGFVSSRAPLMLFLIQQRFGGPDSPVTSDSHTSLLLQPPPMPPDAPASFAPWIRTFPSSFSLPLCWKRNELALLSSGIGGLPLLQEVAAHTFVICNDLIHLLKAGLLQRIAGNDKPLFPLEQLTWDSWVWAAAAQMSRSFPVECYLNENQTIPQLLNKLSLPRSELNQVVWDDLGVLVPFMDMLNHEPTSCQIKWERTPSDADEPALPRLVTQKRVKKGAQIFTDYGSNKSNHDLLAQYGFSQVSNPADSISIGWGLMEGVGGLTTTPEGYDWVYPEGTPQENKVFETNDSADMKSWWTDQRLKLLKLVTGVDDGFIEKLLSGKKLSALACVEGPHHPIFLASAVVCTMSPRELNRHMASSDNDANRDLSEVPLTPRHQCALRQYLAYFYSRKLEKLLGNLNEGFIKAHYPNFQLWSSASEGGLHYKSDANAAETGGSIGWQTFFDAHVYAGTMEVEKHYYALSPDSCVLSLYDGNLRAIQARLDATNETTEQSADKANDLATELTNLRFVLLDTDEIVDEDIDSSKEEPNKSPDKAPPTHEDQNELPTEPIKRSRDEERRGSGDKSQDKSQDLDPDGSARNRKKGRPKNSTNGNSSHKPTPNPARKSSAGNPMKESNNTNRPMAVKLHIGNLSYVTRPEDLFEFFATSLGFGAQNVLECHIPSERDTGKSRGFGFVTMPEDCALRALAMTTGTGPGGIEKKCELQGRLIKVSRSNTAGSNRGAGLHGPAIAAAAAAAATNNSRVASTVAMPHTASTSDRCLKCGYRPKYCTCPVPHVPTTAPGAGAIIPPPPPGPPPRSGGVLPFAVHGGGTGLIDEGVIPSHAPFGVPGAGMPGAYGPPIMGVVPPNAQFGHPNRGGPDLHHHGNPQWAGPGARGAGARAGPPLTGDPRGPKVPRDRGALDRSRSPSLSRRDSRRRRSRSYSRERDRRGKRGRRRDYSSSDSEASSVRHRRRSSRLTSDKYRDRRRGGSYRDRSPLTSSDSEGGGGRHVKAGSTGRRSSSRRDNHRTSRSSRHGHDRHGDAIDGSDVSVAGAKIPASGGSQDSPGDGVARNSRSHRRKRRSRSRSGSRSLSQSPSQSRSSRKHKTNAEGGDPTDRQRARSHREHGAKLTRDRR